MQNSQAAFANQPSLAGSWNAPSQVGVAVNPMTPMQPAMGVYSAGQNIVAPGNMCNVTPVLAPAPSNAEMVNSGLPSQNTDRSESKLGKDASHGTLSSSGEGRPLKKDSLRLFPADPRWPPASCHAHLSWGAFPAVPGCELQSTTLKHPSGLPGSLFHALSLILPYNWHGPHVLTRVRIRDGASAGNSLKGRLVHIAPACAGSLEGSDHFKSYVCSNSLHFCKRT
jgi:hypothetical protein